MPSDLRDYGVIGNLHTAALVSRSGSIDWACLPRFASPSVFARLLDTARGGFHEIRPDERAESLQAYLPSTNLLQTRFFLSGHRRLDIVDFMPIVPGLGEEGAAMIVRMIEVAGGPVPVHATMAPRFEYGKREARWSQESQGLVARDATGTILYRAQWHRDEIDDAPARELVVLPDAPAAIEIIWGDRRPLTTAPMDLLRLTERYWRQWVHHPETPLHVIAGRWHEWLERSELALKLLSHEDTGAFVAAPTASLPEWPGGSRNWDYRYVWIRDAAFSAQSLLLLGHLREARAFLRWVISRIGPGGKLSVVYGAHEGTDLTERTITGLRGFLGSRPVRVGNGAARQFQLDIYGEFLDAAAFMADLDAEFLASVWPQISRVADEVASVWRRPDRGIWEVRGPPAQYVHSKLMAWVALDRSIRLSDRFGGADRVDAWREAEDEIRTWLLTEGYHSRGRYFRQAAGRSTTDAANLRIPLVGFLPFEDDRVQGTLQRVRSELATGPFVYRYRSSDGLSDPEGTFLPASFWLVECWARSHRRQVALSAFERLLSAASPLGLFSEEYDPRRQRLLGNFPQALTHVALLRAAIALGISLSPTFLRRELFWLRPSAHRPAAEAAVPPSLPAAGPR
jgi:GH15 family glucan-1,4-alpha-glucosidase